MATNHHTSRHNVPAARELRGAQTPAEVILWEAIRNRRLGGLKFRRQHPIGPYVADFCCPERRLIVELDGGVHETRRDEDAAREALLRIAGYTVVRFPNEAVTSDLGTLLTAIRAAAEAQPPPSGAPPFRAGALHRRR